MARITFEVSAEQHSYIKMMAASKGISIRDFFLQQMEKSIPAQENRKLSRRTRKTLERADRHQNLNFAADSQELYSELGLLAYIAEPVQSQPAGKVKQISELTNKVTTKRAA